MEIANRIVRSGAKASKRRVSAPLRAGLRLRAGRVAGRRRLGTASRPAGSHHGQPGRPDEHPGDFRFKEGTVPFQNRRGGLRDYAQRYSPFRDAQHSRLAAHGARRGRGADRCQRLGHQHPWIQSPVLHQVAGAGRREDRLQPRIFRGVLGPAGCPSREYRTHRSDSRAGWNGVGRQRRERGHQHHHP